MGEQASGHEPGLSRAAGSETAEVSANLGARSRHGARGRSDEDGRALDAVLLQQLLPVLPCPNRHHPARRLEPGERVGLRRRARGGIYQRGGDRIPGPRPAPPLIFSPPQVGSWFGLGLGDAGANPPKVILLET